ASFISTSATSSSVRPRKSAADPILKPPRCRRRRLRASMVSVSVTELHRLLGPCCRVVRAQPALAILDHPRPCRAPGLLKDFYDPDGIRMDATHPSPRDAAVFDPKLVTPRPDTRHRSGMGHRDDFAPLQPSEQSASRDPRIG